MAVPAGTRLPETASMQRCARRPPRGRHNILHPLMTILRLTQCVRPPRLAVAVVLLPLLGGCAMIKKKAVGMVADTLASSGDVFTRDEDLELVGQAIPFGLKLYEALLDSDPKNKD